VAHRVRDELRHEHLQVVKRAVVDVGADHVVHDATPETCGAGSTRELFLVMLHDRKICQRVPANQRWSGRGRYHR
jgi:hypothetical protein